MSMENTRAQNRLFEMTGKEAELLDNFKSVYILYNIIFNSP